MRLHRDHVLQQSEGPSREEARVQDAPLEGGLGRGRDGPRADGAGTGGRAGRPGRGDGGRQEKSAPLAGR